MNIAKQELAGFGIVLLIIIYAIGNGNIQVYVIGIFAIIFVVIKLIELRKEKVSKNNLNKN